MKYFLVNRADRIRVLPEFNYDGKFTLASGGKREILESMREFYTPYRVKGVLIIAEVESEVAEEAVEPVEVEEVVEVAAESVEEVVEVAVVEPIIEEVDEVAVEPIVEEVTAEPVVEEVKESRRSKRQQNAE